MNPDVWVGDMTRRISGRGFNLVGVADAAAFDAAAPAGHRLRDLLPGARSAVMIAVGGRGLWGHATASGKSMCLALQNATPDPDPIDRFTRDVVSAEAARFGTAFPSARLRVAYPFGDEAADVSFARLAEEAGLGSADTVLRLLLHPEYGPWVSLRACLLTDLELRRDGRLRDFRPCEGCRRPCLDVCPAGVVTPAGWDHDACFAYRLEGPNCLDGCEPRMACPVGAQHRFGPAEMRHRQIAALP
jgi:epoxyqueuosine reductase QueG